MRNPLDAWRQRRARRQFMPRVKRSRVSRTAVVSALALVVLVAAAVVLQLRRGTDEQVEFVAFARAAAEDPLALIVDAATTHRLVFVSDVPSAMAPKRFARDAIERIAAGPGLDLVVLDIDADEQPWIDRYLATSPEDASILMGRPRAIRESDGASRTYVDIYRAVWSINQELSPARRVRIVAADAPGWPPAQTASPAEAARQFGRRTDYMLKHVMERSLARDPNARVFFFVDGLQALKSGGGRVQTGGAAPIETTWLAVRLREFFPGDVYTVLVDATPSRSVRTDVATYRGTEFGEVLHRGRMRSGSALRVGSMFNSVSQSPIRVVDTTGIEFTLTPRTVMLSELADAYVYFGN